MNSDVSSFKDLTPEEREFIHQAMIFFEDPGWLMNGMNALGDSLERAQSFLPQRTQKLIHRSTQAALIKAFEFSLKTLQNTSLSANQTLQERHDILKQSKRFHRGATGLVGGIGGALGLIGLPLELPLSTVLMLRSIADIAQNFGEDLHSPEGQLQCLHVFSLGTRSNNDDGLESSYYASRIALASLLRNASSYLSRVASGELLSSLEIANAPAVVKLLSKIAAAFEMRVTNKALSQIAPLLGAVTGAGLNALFTKFFQDCAYHHFGLRQLERRHGMELIKAEFDEQRKLFQESRRSS